MQNAGPYDASAAVITKSGSSSSAAFVAGAALLIRQYLSDGWYPRGVRNVSNIKYRNPSAALVKAMLINSARSTAGTVVTYTYESPPATCASCPPWVEPPPNISVVQLKSSFAYSNPSATPNIYEGFGRPELHNILWVASAENSTYSLFLAENTFSSPGMMHMYTFLVANNQGTESFGMQMKVTLAYTDPPGVPGSAKLLVNDLDLVVQKLVTSVVWDVNLAQEVTKTSFVSSYGNSNSGVADRSNTVEEVILYAGKNEQDVVNVTVVVVSYKLAPSYSKAFGGQSYALVVTGSLMIRIHYWRSIRDSILAVAGSVGSSNAIDDGVKTAFNIIDYLKLGFFTAENIWMRWKQIGLPAQDQIIAGNLASEADADQNGIVDLQEFAEIIYLLRQNSMQARDPLFESVLADPAFMGDYTSQFSVPTKSFSSNLRPISALFCSSFVILTYYLLIISFVGPEIA